MARATSVSLLGFTLLVLAAGPAGAHASFVSSTPRPGTGVAQAPGDVVLRFSEPLVPSGSRVEVRDTTGASVTSGPTSQVAGDDRAMRRSLGLLAPGVYTVEWSTLSPLDGHTLHGSYRFAVGSSVSGGEQVQASPRSSEGVLGLLGRFTALGALAVWIGALLVRRASHLTGVPDRLQLAVRTIAPCLVVLGTGLSLLSTSLVAGGGAGTLWAVATGGSSGWFRLGVMSLGVAGAILARRAPHRLLVTVAAAAVVAEAASGHAAANPDPLVATGAFASHLAAAGVWIVCIAFSLLATTPTKAALRTFSPVAVGAGVLVAVTGTASAALQLNTIDELSTTAYGRTLTVKVAAVGLMAVAGLVHRRRRATDTDRQLRRTLAAEAIAALAVIGLATALVGFPNPPREAAAAELAEDTRSRLATILERPATSFAATSGPYVVGVTVTAPTAGRSHALVQVLGTRPDDAVRDMALRAEAGTRLQRAELAGCGPDCWHGDIELGPDERGQSGPRSITVSGRSNRGDIAVTETVPPPGREGRQAFDRMLAAMAQVDSVTVDEALRESAEQASIDSTYHFEAPDTMRWTVTTGGSTRIAMGKTGYLRAASDEPFTRYTWPGEGFSWPQNFYTGFFEGAEAVQLIDEKEVDGRPTRVVTFVQPIYPAWYRLEIDAATGRLLGIAMRAEGHVMDQRFQRYDQPVRITAPEAVGGPAAQAPSSTSPG